MSISYMSWSPNFDKEISRASGKNGINRMECSTTYTVTMTLQSLHQLCSSRWAADIKDVCIIVSTTSSKEQSIMDSWILEGAVDKTFWPKDQWLALINGLMKEMVLSIDI
jgi:hypothetical protein